MNNYDDLKTLAKNVSRFVVGAEGNISKKVGDLFYIKSSGSFLSNLNDSDIVCYDFNGNQKDNFNKKGSMELNFHLYFLKNKEINYVCHTHPTNTLKILCSNYSKEFSKKRLFPDQVIFNGKKSCLVPYSTPGKELFDNIEECVSNFINKEKTFPKLILLENHGIIACGKTVDECVVITEICEKSAEIFIDTIKLKSVNYLTNSEIDKLLNDENEKYRKSLI
jgi:ribulose-5-phosphate 4-epimerase/fuculose-1-phosphate aldolase